MNGQKKQRGVRQRKTWETEEHLQAERSFADCLANKWSMFTWTKASMEIGFDYWVYDDDKRVRAVCEIKVRNIFSTSYVSIMISKRKFENIRTMCDLWGFKINNDGTTATVSPVYGIFAFRFLDGDFYYRYEKNEFLKHWADGNVWEEKGAGRTKDTRDRWDIEDIIHIDRKLLIPIDVKFKTGIVHGRRSRKFCEYEKKPYEIKG